jgi:Bardet-Biedl syndrome 2 protein
VHILTEDIELAGDVLQDLCAALQITELESVAEFPREMEAFRAVLLRVDEYNATRLKLTAEMADQSNAAKTLVIRAEDARILGDVKAMRGAYSELYSLNAELIGEYNKRANNHEQLLAALKEVNHMIQKTARLRVGSAKARVVSECRAAIKANNIHSLFKCARLTLRVALPQIALTARTLPGCHPLICASRRFICVRFDSRNRIMKSGSP